MDLEARSLQLNVKAVLLAKLREYKSDLNNLKSEVKRLVAGNLNVAAQDKLLESSMADTITVCLDQTMLETKELGVSILQDLHSQRQSLLHAHDLEFKPIF
ncbi:hypothetical protein UlMin_002843 [Ulmus minor]